MKYCVNCKHHLLVHPPVHGVGEVKHMCLAPCGTLDMVTGKPDLVDKECGVSRTARNALCGPKARLFASPDELAVKGTSDGVSCL